MTAANAAVILSVSEGSAFFGDSNSRFFAAEACPERSRRGDSE